MKFAKGQSGNPAGRKRGSRNKATALRDQLEADASALIRKAVELAKGGDVAALRMCLDRILPPLRAETSPQEIEAKGDDLASLASSIVREAVAGRISAEAAKELTAALSAVGRLKELCEFEQRLAALESKLKTADESFPQTPFGRR